MTPLSGFFEDLAIWALGALATILAPIAGVVRGNHRRSTNNKRQLQGDPTDPNTPGVLKLSKETNELSKRNGEKIDNLEEKMEEQHGVVLGEVEELAREIRNNGD